MLLVLIVSPLGSYKAVINVMKASSGVFILTGYDGEELDGMGRIFGKMEIFEFHLLSEKIIKA